MADTEQQRAWVERVLEYRFANAGQGGQPGAAIRLAQGMLLWNQTRSHVADQIKSLQRTILADTVGEPDHDEIAGGIGNLDAILEVLDDRLTGKLNALRGTTDAQEKTKLSDEARGIVREYQSYVERDELMSEIDRNGFVPLDIKARVTKTLQDVLETI